MNKRTIRIVLAILCIVLLFVVSSCNKSARPDYNTLYDSYISLDEDMATVFLYFEKDPDITFREASKAFDEIYSTWSSVVNPK